MKLVHTFRWLSVLWLIGWTGCSWGNTTQLLFARLTKPYFNLFPVFFLFKVTILIGEIGSLYLTLNTLGAVGCRRPAAGEQSRALGPLLKVPDRPLFQNHTWCWSRDLNQQPSGHELNSLTARSTQPPSFHPCIGQCLRSSWTEWSESILQMTWKLIHLIFACCIASLASLTASFQLHPLFIHFLSQRLLRPGAYPSNRWVRAGWRSGQVGSLSQRHIERQISVHTNAHLRAIQSWLMPVDPFKRFQLLL